MHLSSSDKKKTVHGLKQEGAEENLIAILRWIKSIRRYHSWKVCTYELMMTVKSN